MSDSGFLVGAPRAQRIIVVNSGAPMPKAKSHIAGCLECGEMVRFDTDGDGNTVQLDYTTYKRHRHPLRVRKAE